MSVIGFEEKLFHLRTCLHLILLFLSLTRPVG